MEQPDNSSAMREQSSVNPAAAGFDKRKSERRLQVMRDDYDWIFGTSLALAPSCLVGAVSVMDKGLLILLLVSGILFAQALVLSRRLERGVDEGRQAIESEASAARAARLMRVPREERTQLKDEEFLVLDVDYARAYERMWTKVASERKLFRLTMGLWILGIAALVAAVFVQYRSIDVAASKASACQTSPAGVTAPQPSGGANGNPRGRQ